MLRTWMTALALSVCASLAFPEDDAAAPDGAFTLPPAPEPEPK